MPDELKLKYELALELALTLAESDETDVVPYQVREWGEDELFEWIEIGWSYEWNGSDWFISKTDVVVPLKLSERIINVLLDMADMTRTDLARNLGMSRQSVSNYANGVTYLSVEKLDEIAGVLGYELEVRIKEK